MTTGVQSDQSNSPSLVNNTTASDEDPTIELRGDPVSDQGWIESDTLTFADEVGMDAPPDNTNPSEETIMTPANTIDVESEAPSPSTSVHQGVPVAEEVDDTTPSDVADNNNGIQSTTEDENTHEGDQIEEDMNEPAIIKRYRVKYTV